MSENNGIALNTILYGPPGTGKTYNAVIYAVAICDAASKDKSVGEKCQKSIRDYYEKLKEIAKTKDGYDKIKERYDKLMAPPENGGEGRIAFTTFHQSYGYEEFIEGIRPVMKDDAPQDSNGVKELLYKIEPGVFKKFCDDAKKKFQNGECENADNSSTQNVPASNNISQREDGIEPLNAEQVSGHDASLKHSNAPVIRLNKQPIWLTSLGAKKKSREKIQPYCFNNDCIMHGKEEGSTEYRYLFEEMQVNDLIIVQEGTKKIVGFAKALPLQKDINIDPIDGYKYIRKVEWLAKGIDYANISSFKNNGLPPMNTLCKCNSLKEDALQTLKTIIEDYNTNITIDWEGNQEKPQSPEKISDIGTAGEPTLDDNDKRLPYVFIIDEINRGNISKIFGELITLIEDTKREGEDEAASAILPYSGESFSVPKNVYILGTMNTADRSIALMDTALRRRFNFEEMMPDPDLLKVKDSSGKETDLVINGINIRLMLETINDRIEYLYDREHTIGHAFFIKLLKEENQTLDVLAEIFRNKIIPLLQEYFYDDYAKIRLVLGGNFIIVEVEPIDLFDKQSNLTPGELSDLETKKEYSIITANAYYKSPEAYLGIYLTQEQIDKMKNKDNKPENANGQDVDQQSGSAPKAEDLETVQGDDNLSGSANLQE